MSAFLCSVRHINALATFAQARRIRLTLNNGDCIDATHSAQAFADILLAGNIASLRARYPADDDYRPDYAITWRPADAADLAPVVVLKSAQCFNYQACEVDDYEASDCATIVRAIMTEAIRALDGYAEAPWGLDGEEPLPKVQRLAPARGKATQGDLMTLLFPNGAVSLDDVAAATEAQPTPAPTPAKPAPRKPTKPAPADDQQDGPF
jgi:hypothetical protein